MTVAISWFACDVNYRLPKSVKRRLKALKRLQAEANKVESRFYEEVHEIERKYMAQYEPFFQRVIYFFVSDVNTTLVKMWDFV